MKIGLIQDIDVSHGTIFFIDIQTGQELEGFWFGFLAADAGATAVFKTDENGDYVLLHVMNSTFEVNIPEFNADVISLEEFRNTRRIVKVA